MGTFLERYRGLIYHCISHFEQDASGRDDLYQELVLYILERLDRGSFDSDKGSLGTWLYRVAWCRCVDIKRRERSRRRPRLTIVGDDMPEQVDEHPGPEEEAGTMEVGGYVRQAMSSLEPEQRTLLDRRFVQGETLGKISGDLSISLEQTKYRLRRATISLRKVLLNEYALEEA